MVLAERLVVTEDGSDGCLVAIDVDVALLDLVPQMLELIEGSIEDGIILLHGFRPGE